MGEVKIHHYTYNHIWGYSKCGLDHEKLKDYSNNVKWVNCKKCLSKTKNKTL